MKKILFSLLLCIMFLPIYVYADADTLVLECSSTSVNVGDSFSCNLSVVPASPIANMTIPFTISDGLVIESFQANTDALQVMSTPSIDKTIEFITSESITARTLIGKFNFKVSNDFSGNSVKININAARVSTSNGDSIVDKPDQTAPVEVTINVSSGSVVTENGLKSLSATGGVLSPQFTRDNYSYALLLSDASVNSFGLASEASNSADSIIYLNTDTNETISDSSNITYKTEQGKSSMAIEIKVGTGENEKKYTVLVSKPLNVDGKPFLSSLVVGGKNISLKNDNSEFEEVNTSLSDVSSYQVKAVLADSDKYEITTNLTNGCQTNGGTLTCNLNGANSFTITVNSKDGSVASKTYILSIDKGNTQTSTNVNTVQNPQTGYMKEWIIGLIMLISISISLFMLYNYKFKTNN